MAVHIIGNNILDTAHIQAQSGGGSPAPPDPVLLPDLFEMWEYEASPGLLVGSHAAKVLTEEGDVTSISGKVGQAASGVDDANYLSIGEASGVGTADSGRGSWTVLAWVRVPGLEECSENLLAKFNEAFDATDFGTFFQIDSGGNFTILATKYGGSDSISASASVASYAGQWVFGMARYDADARTISARINNGTVQSTTAANSWPAITDGSAFTFGAGNLGTFNVDQLMLYHRAVPDAQVLAIYNGGSGMTYAQVAAYTG